MGGPSSAISENNIFNELCVIKNQIEKLFAIQSAEKMNCPNRNFIYVKPQVCKASKNQIGSFPASALKGSNQNLHTDPKLLHTSVHINPNFIPQKPTVHINPSVHTKDVHMIHVNPKIMNHIVNSNQSTPINRANPSATETNIDKTVNPSNVKTSIHVNPTLLKHLKETMTTSSKEPVTKEQSVCLRSKPFKNISNQISPKRTGNTGIVHLSRRKLVRVASTAKVSKNPISQGNKSINRSKVTKYKIDRTVLQVRKLKRNCLERRKVRDNMTKLVTIGDIVYKASKNKLIRNSSSLKRRKSISGKGSKLNIATSDKKQRTLRRSFNVLNRTLDTNTSSKTRYSFNISPKTTYKNSISNKAKQKSIRILRNKMHKNNQPCLIFQRFGSCPNHNKGTCPKRHDKKQVSLCKKFLQGKCLLDKCPLSHDVGPEKMPTCKYFLDGRCTRDNCPYVHVKVSSTTLICIDFLRGYCAKGNKCQRRHEYLCPEFDRAGKCKLEKCPYPHKSHSSHPEKNAKYSSKTRDAQEDHKAARNESETPNPESRPRYYEVTNDVSREFEKKKDTVQRIDSSVKETEDIKSLPLRDGHASETKGNAKDQVCIGGYIPIDPSN